MTEKEMMRLIKQGVPDHIIRSRARTHYDFSDDFHRNSHASQRVQENYAPQQKEPLLEGIHSAGFADLEPTGSKVSGGRRSTKYAGHYAGFALEATWSESAATPSACSFALVLTSPRGEQWHLCRWKGNGTSLADALARFIRQREKIDREEQDIGLMLQKARKKLEIGHSTIKAVIHRLENTPGLSYNLCTEGADTFVRVKMKYRRCIIIKLRPDMNLAHIAGIMEMIARISEALDKAGPINLTVKNFSSNIKWKHSTGAPPEEGK